MQRSDLLEQAAAAVLDGTAVDWDALEARAGSGAREAIRELRGLERLARAHQVPVDGGWPRAAAMRHGTADEAAPRRWAHLELREQIGRGAFGEVYRAWDATLARDVALKLLPAFAPGASGGRDASFVLEEGRRLARIRHPNVVTIHGAARIDHQIGLWMELVPGVTLEEQLERHGPSSPAETVRIGLALCSALSAVHAAGLLHRDIKAQNVMQAADGRVVLMDFGAGRDLADGGAEHFAGTPLYLAPEVFAGGPATAQQDIYALGVLLYHLLTGGYPVTGRTLGDITEAHTGGARVPLRRLRPRVPAALANVIDRAVHPDPAHRYASAGALAAALASLDTRRRRVRRATAACVAAAALAVLAWTWRGGAEGGGRLRLAVLPLATETGGDAERTLTSGLGQELQRSLATIGGLSVIGFGSTSGDAAAGTSALAAGQSLDADYVLEGSTAWSDEGVQVDARLLRIDGGQLAWTRTYHRPRHDLLSIQDEISREIAAELRLPPGLRRRHAIGPDVYYDFLRARDLQSKRSADHMRDAAVLFEEVVALAPLYAPAWAGIATSLAAEARLRDAPFPPRVRVTAQRAIQLDELDADAQQAMGNLFAASLHWREADEAFLRALTINPSLTFLYTEFVLSSLLPQNRLDDALRYLDSAQRLSPLSLDVRRVKALVLVEAGRYEEAMETSRWVLARDPAFPFANLWLGRALALSGRAEEALAHYGADPATAAYRGYALAVLGRRAEAERIAGALAAEPHRQMLVYGGLGDAERAFAALERVVAQNPWRAATWMLRPEVALLRDDPRFEIVQNQLGLPAGPPQARTLVDRLLRR